MRIGYAVMSAIVQQKSTFLFFVIFVLNNGIYYQLYINNIEKVIGFSFGCSPLWADRKQTERKPY